MCIRDRLDPCNAVNTVHAVLLSGGSAWGLDAASGVMRWLESQGIGLDVGSALVPIVPAAVLFDLLVGDAHIRPDAQAGYAACQVASSQPPAEGNVGAGTGAAIGKMFGMPFAMKGGIGTASVTLDGVTVGALIACNALGDIVDPDTGALIAGARTGDGAGLRDTRRSLLRGEPPLPILAGTNTTIGVIATDAVIIPLHCEYFALEGLADLVGTLQRVRAALNPDLDIDGVLMTMYDERTNLGQQVSQNVRDFFKEKVFETVIPRNVRLGEAPSHGMPCLLYTSPSPRD